MDRSDSQKPSFDFGVHDSHLNPIKDKIEAWVKNGWKQWEEEKLECFTDEFRASVPEYMIKNNGQEEEAKNDNKVAPFGEGGDIDQEEFMRVMERRGSMNL
ncbi:hypothetical protein TrLO_g13643 [Triparma laevis f. longispina]|uniref:Uncharacterized protein n=1 Tax=Triparma laevis f. longispina TaxID=1714387 RepID=A0A9W7E0K7_9STRA|nr:hypothetical protein TrLO_g13643 [Triparma laevis f. longispina]